MLILTTGSQTRVEQTLVEHKNNKKEINGDSLRQWSCTGRSQFIQFVFMTCKFVFSVNCDERKSPQELGLNLGSRIFFPKVYNILYSVISRKK